MPIIVALILLGTAVGAGMLASAGAGYPAALLVVALLMGLFAFFSPKLSLVLLVFSMLLSPELGGGAVDPGRSVVVRYDDILLVIIFLSWSAKTALFKTRPFITSTPVQTPIMLYTAVCVLSTALGILRGDVDARASFFYLLKYIEYFLLYFMTVNIVESEEEVRKYMRYGLIVAVAVTAYAYYYYYASGAGPMARATAPFEVPLNGDLNESEPASLGGYYLVIFGVVMAMLTQTGGYVFLLAVGMLVFMFPAFLLTFSRSSYIGFSFMVPALFLLSGRRRLFLAGFLAAGMAGMAFFPGMYRRVEDRITMTYKGDAAVQTFRTGVGGTVRLEDSAASRVHSVRKVFLHRLPERPILGWGVTGVGLCDTQYALVPGETGILGSALFIWMLIRLFHTARTVFLRYDSPLTRSLGLGFMVFLTGLLFQSLGVNSFV
ncbi:MAG TPA: O-antigen ligase family protein, partial [Elusimicrobiales bacterium]|nr:O-antigen ligase family protein [Elusimicrobiales bacterium]